MPLKSGRSKKIISKNIKEMVISAKKKGKIGNVSTSSTKKMQQVAAAIAYDKAGKSKMTLRKGRK